MCAAERTTDPSARRIAVIGAGWAGCAAAVELARGGAQVTLFESARTLGGRARRVDLEDLALDNGQHILLGAYTETLRMMRTVGVDTKRTLLTLPLQMRYPKDGSGMDFLAPRLPAPLHLLVALWHADGLAREDKLSLARFSTTARWMGWQLHTDCTVEELLHRFDQTERLTRLMWRPLCIAALNTPPERASAQIFLNVLRDSLGARRAASDMLIPRADLSALFPLQAGAFVERHGGSVKTGVTVQNIRRDGPRWRLMLSGDHGAPSDTAEFDALVVATQPGHAASLLNGVVDTTRLRAFDYESITTCYLRYPATVRLSWPFLALLDDPATGDWGQFVFDRGQLNPAHAGLLSVVVSASAQAIAPGADALATAITAQLAEVLRQPELRQPVWSKVITEKRATFSCTPALARPANDTGCDGLVLAGDYTASDYPATLEAAVRSGMQAARLVAA